MKIRNSRFLILTAALSLLLSGCGNNVDIGGNTDEPIGGDWRVWRGYTDPYQLYNPEDIIFSLFSSEDEPVSYGYAAYDNSNGFRIGALVLPKNGKYKQEDEADPAILNKDLNEDGIWEFGISFKNGEVVWFGYDQDLAMDFDPFASNPFVVIGTGDSDGVLADAENERGLSHRLVHLSETEMFHTVLEGCDDNGNIIISLVDPASLQEVSQIILSGNIGMEPSAILQDQYGLKLLSSDLNYDGINEIGIPFDDGQVFWFGYHPENNEDELFILEGTGTENGILSSDNFPTYLTESVQITALFGNDPERLSIDIIDAQDQTLYGTIYFNDPDLTANDVVCNQDNEPEILTCDLDMIPPHEVGIPLLDGTIHWFSLEDGEFWNLGIEDEHGMIGNNEVDLFDTLISAIPDRLEGLTVIRSADIEIDGILCQQFIAGTDHEDHFTAEYHFAVSPDGTVYELDVQNGNEYRVVQP